MATLPLAISERDAALASTPRTEKETPRGRSIFRRLYDGIIVARQMQAEREIARYLEMTGGKLTDSVEREIERRFISGGSK